MGTIEINLFADMASIMRQELVEIGYKVNIPDDRELLNYYFTTCNRIISARPRKVHEAAEMVVPSSRRSGYDALKDKFEKGISVMPHLSKQIKGLKFQDKMLFDWGIQHFHLGTTLEPDGFIKQYNEILYVIVENDDVYFITVDEHDHWSDIDLLEKVLANWPHLLKSYQTGGTPTVQFSSKEIEALREFNVNTIVTLSDGHGYMGRGMGMTGAGTSADAVLNTNQMARTLQQFEKDIKQQYIPKDDETLRFSLLRKPDGIYLTEANSTQQSQLFNFKSLKSKIEGK